MPTVQIGVPARNEGRFIAETLESVQAQGLTDWELTVSDNASTDDTPEIVRRYAARDPRIRLDRLTSPVSQTENFNRLGRDLRAPYFVWLGGHDRWLPTFLSGCVDALERSPNLVLCFTDAVVIDGDGQRRTIPWVVEPEGLPGPLPSLDTRFSPTPEARFLTFLFAGTNGTHIHGVIRTEALRRTPLMRPCLFPDAPLLGQLALLGPFARLEGPPLFECRVARLKSWQERVNTLADEGPDGPPAWARLLPSLHWAYESMSAPLRCDVPAASRAAAVTGAVIYTVTSLRRMLVMELLSAARRLSGRGADQDAWMNTPAT
jgi:hypothetical protein